MKYLLVILSLSLIQSVGMIASAKADSVNPRNVEQEEQEFTFSHSEIDARNLNDNRILKSASSASLEVVFSSWEPKSLQLPSLIGTPSDFSENALPELELNIVVPASRDFNIVGGVGFLSLQRSGSLTVNSQTVSDEQTAYLGTVRFGAEFEPQKLRSRVLTPYASLSLLPTLVATSRSSFDDGSSQFGVPVEFSVGSLIHLFHSADLNVGASAQAGKAGSSNLGGVGINAGVRMSL